jgi:hypothetical protein
VAVSVWDRRDNETGPAYEAFRAYLELGPERSLAKVGAKLGKSKALMDRWSARHDWADRAQAFDQQGYRRRDDAHLDAIASRAKRQAELAQLAEEALSTVTLSFLRKVQDAQALNEDPFAGVSMDRHARLVAEGTRALRAAVVTERLALGMSTSLEGEADTDREREAARRMAEADRAVDGMTDAELDAFLAGAAAGAAATTPAKPKRKAKA